MRIAAAIVAATTAAVSLAHAQTTVAPTPVPQPQPACVEGRHSQRRRLPIVIDGKLVGAIGASGGIFTQDAVTAKAGLEAVKAQTK